MQLMSLFLFGLFLITSGAIGDVHSNYSENSYQVKTLDNSKDNDRRMRREIRRAKRKARREARRRRAELAREQVAIDKCSIYSKQQPECWHKRDESVLNVALVYYGDAMKIDDLDRIEILLKERFLKSTRNQIKVNVIAKRVMTYKTRMPVGFTYNNITDKKRLQRIWYYNNVGAKIVTEVYEEYKKVESKEVLDKLDSILTITGAQFNGLGFASGRVSVTEYPTEIAFGLEDGGRVKYGSDYTIVDELIHELGHNMFLGHTSTQCQKPGMTYQESQACCDSSPSKNDVMSYCRKRDNVSPSFMHGFEACNMDMIENKIIPNMLSGGTWFAENRTRCQ